MLAADFGTKTIEDKINEVCYLYKYKLQYVMKRLSLDNLFSLFNSALKIESMFRGVEYKTPDSKKLLKEKRTQAYRAAVILGKQK